MKWPLDRLMIVKTRKTKLALSRQNAQALGARAQEAAKLLKLLANERRLLILCRLIEVGEMNVSQLAEAVDLTQSALSQHLAKMREDGLVTFRRESLTIWYRIADPKAARVLQTLHDLFVTEAGVGPSSGEECSN